MQKIDKRNIKLKRERIKGEINVINSCFKKIKLLDLQKCLCKQTKKQTNKPKTDITFVKRGFKLILSLWIPIHIEILK